MKLLLADDHALFRDALFHFIKRALPDTDVLLAQDVAEVLHILEQGEKFDLVILDYGMPGMNGSDGLRLIKNRYPDQKMALISGMAEEDEVKEALKAGAVAYLPKTLSGKSMLRAIQKVVEGQNFVPRDEITGSLIPSYYDYPVYSGTIERPAEYTINDTTSSVQSGFGSPLSSLSGREREVLACLCQGLANKDIAARLKVQVVTIKLHIRSICRKLNVKNRTQAALLAQDIASREGML